MRRISARSVPALPAAALTAAALLVLSGCGGGGQEQQPERVESGGDAQTEATSTTDDSGAGSGEGTPVTDISTVEHDRFSEPWALEFLPESDHLLITERTGAIHLRDQNSGESQELDGVPEVEAAGQGGMHDVIAGPSYADDGTVYLSWVRPAPGGSQGVVGRAHLDADGAALSDLEVIWEQDPASGTGHFSLRLAVADEHLFVTSGDRQELDPAQDMSTNLGTLVRLTLDGEPAPGNPYADDGAPAEEFWTTGHRNALGIAADSHGRLWSSEMGPQGGDELNLIEEGANYGWPEASMGEHYSGEEIPDHSDDDGFAPPREYWVPAMSPGNLLIYQGEAFSGWQDSALLGGLSGENLVRVELGEDGTAEQADEWDMGERVRALAEAPDGSIWFAADSGLLAEIQP